MAKMQLIQEGKPESIEEAWKALQAANQRQLDDIGLALSFAQLSRRKAEQKDDPSLIALADLTMDRMVAAEANQENAEAWLARHRYRVTYDLADADDDLRKALQFADSPELLQATGDAALARSRQEEDPSQAAAWVEKSIEVLSKATAADAPAPGSFLGLGNAYESQDKIDQAIETWEQGLRELPESSLSEILLLRLKLADTYLGRNDLEKSREQLDQLQKLATQVARQGKWFQTQRNLVNIENSVELLNGRILLAENKPEEVVNEMDRLLSSLPSVPSDDAERLTRYQTLKTLGRAHLLLRQWEEAATALTEAAGLWKDQGEVAFLAARAWQASGNNRRAAELIEQSTQDGGGPEAWLTLAELELSRQLAQPRQGRDWSSFDRALRNFQSAKPQDWRVNLLAAARALAVPEEGGRDEAIKQLNEAESLGPEDPTLWNRLTLLYQQLGLPDQADQAREKFQTLSTEDWAKSMLESELLAARGRLDLSIGAASSALAEAPNDRKNEIRRRLADLNRAAGKPNETRNLLQQILDDQPDNLDVLRSLVQLEMETGNLAKMEEMEQKLKEVEGGDGIFWRYFRARRLLADPDQPSTEALVDAGQLQRAIESRLPGWPPAHVLKGAIFARHGRFADAATAYERAIELGDRRLENFEQQLAALYRSEQYDKAEALVEQLQNYLLSSRTLATLSTAIAARTDHLPEALARAEQLVEQQPEQANARIWLAQLFLLNGRDADAEKQLKQAIMIDRTQLGPWQALFSFSASRNLELAAKILRQMEKVTGNLTNVQHATLLARDYQRIGNLDDAQKWYDKAAEAEPGNPAPHLRIAAMRLNNDSSVAEAELRKALEIDPALKPARQMLALLLAARGGQEEWQEVQQLIGGDAPGSTSDPTTGQAPEDLRLRAVLLMQRGGSENLTEARKALEQAISSSDSPVPSDRLLLATIHETQGNLSAAEEQYDALVQSPTPVPRILFAYTNFLLRNGNTEGASEWLEKLDQATASSGLAERLLNLEAKTRLLIATGKADEISSNIESFAAEQEQALEADQTNERVRLYNAAGQLYLLAQQYEAAEPWFRKLAEIAPERLSQLTRVLALQGRHAEAVELILPQDLGDELPPARSLLALTDILSVGQPEQAVWDRTEPIWQKAAETVEDGAFLPSMAATVRAVQGRNDEAIAILEELLQQSPDQPIVLNNLATLLGQKPGSQEQALQYIDRAIEIAGPQPALLDTKSLILVEMGKPQEAVQILQHLVAVPQPDPRVLFRLAIAQLRVGSPTEALAVFTRALALGLESQVLTVRDQELLQELRSLTPVD